MNDESKQRLLHYSILEKLGVGGNGQVYKAWDTVQERFVALKLLKPHLINTEIFRNRILPIVNKLSCNPHPNICTVFGTHRVDETYLIVTEYLEGVTLQELSKQGSVDNHTFLNIAAQVADGLKHAHEHDITHGNIKPSNIMVIENSQVKIMDFGLSCFPEVSKAASTESSPERLAYLAPEQITSEPITLMADLFSLGVLSYELLSDQRPFVGRTPDAVMSSILNDTPDFATLRARKIPGDTILMIEKLLAKDPSDRFSSAEELVITLQVMQSFEQELATRKLLQVKPRTTRHYLIISLLAALLVALWYVVTTYRH